MLILLLACTPASVVSGPGRGADTGHDVVSETGATPVAGVVWRSQTVPCEDRVALWGPPTGDEVALFAIRPFMAGYVATVTVFDAEAATSIECDGPATVTWAVHE